MRDLVELVVVNVEHVSMRHVAGDGDQAELTVQTRRGSLTLRLILSSVVILGGVWCVIALRR